MANSYIRKLNGLIHGKLDFVYDRYHYNLSGLSKKQVGNYLLNRLEARRRKIKPHSYPIALQLEPTIHCQLDCPLCPRMKATKDMDLGHMKWSDYEKLMSELGPRLIAVSFWQWGEPLLHPRITEMIGLARKFGIMTMISTNAQIDPSDFDLKALFAAGLDLLIISMDGATQETYEQFRQSGEVSKVIDFTKAAVAAKRELGTEYPLLNLRIIATRENEHEISDVRKLAAETGVDVFSVKSVSIYDDADPNNPNLPDNMDFRSFQYQSESSAREYEELPNLCYKPWSWPTLRYDGTLLACECDHASSRILGNVFEAESFREVWTGSKAQELRREFPKDGKITVEFCQRCRYKLDDAIREITHI